MKKAHAFVSLRVVAIDFSPKPSFRVGNIHIIHARGFLARGLL